MMDFYSILSHIDDKMKIGVAIIKMLNKIQNYNSEE